MKRHLILIPMILATTAAIADAQAASSRPADAQSQAAALLGRPHALGAMKTDAPTRSQSAVPVAVDAHESARALLSGVRPGYRVNPLAASAEPLSGRARTDAQAQAAAVLSGSRTSYSAITRR